MKKILSGLLAVIIVLSCFASMTVGVYAEEASSIVQGNVYKFDAKSSYEYSTADAFGITTAGNTMGSLVLLGDAKDDGIVNGCQTYTVSTGNLSLAYRFNESALKAKEVAYNSQSNIFFGYTLKDINELYQGNKYVFTLGEDGSTTVRPFEDYDDTYDRVIKNVAIGTGVILICVTVSVVTGGAGVAPVSLVFAASAKTATAFALSSSAIGAISAGIIEAVRTGDTDAVVESAALAASEGFKWGAISGAFVGGVKEACAINRAKKAIEGAREVAQGTVDVPVDEQPWRQAELRALNEQGGYEQLSYLNGKQVPFGTQGATRPDVVRIVGDHIEAVEVKYYNLESPQSLNTLYNELTREVSARVTNLPAGSTQRIVLDVTGRGFSLETCEAVRDNIWNVLKDIYPNIPIDIVGLV